MTITNLPKISSSVTNQSKINIGLTWDAATMTWAAATFTWDSTASVIGNVARVFGGQIWAYNVLTWQLPTPWLDIGAITNISRPS